MKFLSKKIRCSFCCCMSRRSATLIVGIIDILLGILCVLATVALLAQNLAEQGALRDLEMSDEKGINLQQLIAGFVLVVIACGIPALLTLITGAVGIYSITSENPCVSAYSLALNFLLVTCLSGTDIFLFVLGLRTSLLIVYLVATLLQIYFALILFDFYKLQQRILARWKSDQEETSLSEEARKLARES